MEQHDQGMPETIAQVLAERKNQMSPGRMFAKAYAVDGLDARVEYDVTITDSLTTSRRKRRYPARNMLKIIDLSKTPQRFYWHETPGQPGGRDVTEGGMRLELAHRFHRSPIPELLSTTAWIQLPDGLADDPEALEPFIDYRLVQRLSTAENHTIIRSPGGLLHIEGIRRVTAKGRFASSILAACDGAEQMGGTADGLIINPADYYWFMGQGQLMADLERNGVFIVRTRLVEEGTAIVGDFGHGAQLFDEGRSVIRFAEPPPGTFEAPGAALLAEIRERVVVSLPTHFFVVTV
jgi:hypothetical protein